MLSGEFRSSANNEIKQELIKLGRATILLEAHEDLLDSIRKATENNVRISVDQYPHRHEDTNHLTLNIHTGNIHIDKQVEPLISREKEIAEELKELNVDFLVKEEC